MTSKADTIASKPNAAKVREWVESALKRTFDKDAHLISEHVHERTICHRFAMYLEWLAGAPWIADVEYNRQGKHVKRLEDMAAYGGPYSRGNIFPDVILHCRGPAGPNLAIAEFAWYTSRADFQAKVEILQRKVVLLTDRKRREYAYVAGVIVILQADFEATLAQCKWYP